MDCPKTNLLKARNFQEAKRVLEAIKATPAQYRLTEIAFANPNSRDVLLNDVIREQEGAIDRDDKKTPGEKDLEKKLHEEEVTGGGAGKAQGTTGSEQSSDTTQPYPKEGKDEPNSDIESMQTASGESQMKENMNGGGMIMPGLPPMAPDVMKQMTPQMPQLPPLNTQQQLRQMQYTVEANLRPMMRRLGKIEEAILAMDTKIKETQSAKNSMELKIPTGNNSWFKTNVKETSQDLLEFANSKARLTPAAAALDQRRNEIASLDKQLTRGPYN